MAQINNNFLKLQSGYLFPEISRRVAIFEKENPKLAKEIIRCGIGDVTQPLPSAVRAAMRRAISDMGKSSSFHGYGPEQGYAFLRQKIAENKYQQRGVEIFEDEIFISDGSKCDCANILDIFKSGEKNSVAVSNPVYPVYVDTNVMAGNSGEPMESGKFEGIIYLDCKEKDGFLPQIPENNQSISLIYLCFPNNPTGVAVDKDYLQQWVNFAIKNQAIILYDAAYESFICDKTKVYSIFEIKNAKKCAIEFNSFSKSGGFTGVRCAWTVIPKQLKASDKNGTKHQLHKLWQRRQSTKFNGVSYITQRGAEAIFSSDGKKQVQELVDFYMKNAQILLSACHKKGLSTFGGRNAPYIWVKCPKINGKTDSWQTFDLFLKKAAIVTTPGAGFGSAGEGFFRISAFNTRKNILQVSKRIEEMELN